jgi:hypothetical protein
MFLCATLPYEPKKYTLSGHGLGYQGPEVSEVIYLNYKQDISITLYATPVIEVRPP